MHQSEIPMYHMVAATIKSRIQSHTYQPGEHIPSAKNLAAEFGVSTITIRKAVEKLIQEGYLEPRQGTGTIAILPSLQKVEIKISGNCRQWLDSASGRSPRLDVELLDIGLFRAPQSILSILRSSPSEPVCRVRRVRRHQGRIVSYFINYLDQSLAGRLPKGRLAKKSFIEVFQESTGIRLRRLEQRVEAAIAEMDLAKVLGTQYGSPLFFSENIYYSDQDVPVVITHMYYRGDCYTYRATILLE